VRLVAQPVLEAFSDELVDGGEEGGEGLAGTGGSRDQDMPLRLDGRPRLFLRRGRSIKNPVKPIGYGRMEGGER